MKITDVKVLLLSCPIPPSMRYTSDFGTIVKEDCTIVRVDTDEGIFGYGEATGTPQVLQAIIEKSLRPLLINEDPTRVEFLWEKMYQGTRGLMMGLDRGRVFPLALTRMGEAICAISGIDIALWDILGKHLGQPIYKLLGGGFRERIRAYASQGGWQSPDELAREASTRVKEGFTAYKMRWGMGYELDVARTKVVREVIGPKVDLLIDCHGAQSIPYIQKMALLMEELDVFWLEDPIPYDDIKGYVELKAKLRTPIATGESSFTRFGFRPLVENRVADVLMPDVCICGGLTEARRIAIVADTWNIVVSPHCWRGAVGVAASMHFGASVLNCPIMEAFTSYNPLRSDLLKVSVEPKEGYFEVPDKPGLGIQLDEQEALAKFPFKEGPEREPPKGGAPYHI